jgi:hypothetical protein
MVKSKANGIHYLLIIVSIITLIGCNSYKAVPENLTDQSILTDEPCKAPCWYNLIADKSSKQDALNVLTNLPFIDSTSIRTQNATWWGTTPEESLPAILILANCIEPDVECVNILVLGDIVKYIKIYPNYKITFDEVVNHLGNPDNISTLPYGIECLGCILIFNWSLPSMEISITRNDRRCKAGNEMCQAISNGGKIPIGLEVEEIAYIGSVPLYWQTYSQEYEMPWPGFVEP